MNVKKTSAEQANRIIKIQELFKFNESYTSDKILNELREYYPDLTLRTVQRDLKILAENDIICYERINKEFLWRKTERITVSQAPLQISSNEMLSFYALKAYLKTFKGTQIENDIATLTNKIEHFAPGEVYLEEDFYWHKSLGNYDYSNKYTLITRLLNYINQGDWIIIEYEKQNDNKIKSVEVFPKAIYSYSGTLYLIAYRTDYKKFVSFSIQNLIKIEESFRPHKKIPVFKYDDFQKNRFAVFDGEPTHIKLFIKPDFVKYFENRFWHASQKFTYKRDDLYLEMDVPITPDLVSWICYWHRGIVVQEPEPLKKEVVKALNHAINNYNIYK